MRLYPNPAFHEVQLTGLEADRTYIYRMYSLVGQVVSKGEVKGHSSVDVSDLSSGYYVFVLWSDDRRELLRSHLRLK